MCCMIKLRVYKPENLYMYLRNLYAIAQWVTDNIRACSRVRVNYRERKVIIVNFS